MSSIKTAITMLFKEPSTFFYTILKRYAYLFSDKTYIKLAYRLRMGRNLNLKSPITFTEKLQWLKLYDRNPIYTKMVDKGYAKEYASAILGPEYIIHTIGEWDNPNVIDWEKLPDSFVLKTTHGGGGEGVIICPEKSSINQESIISKLNRCLKQDIFLSSREWPYKNVKKRIIAEEMICVPEGEELMDYKFFCFNGQVKFFKVDFGRFQEHHANYYDVNGNILPFGEIRFRPIHDHKIAIPDKLSEMISLAEKIAIDKPFIRVDFYYIKGKILFGEMTFYPAGGFGKFTEDKWDYIIGEYLTIPS